MKILLLTVAAVFCLIAGLLYLALHDHGKENWEDKKFDQAAWLHVSKERLRSECLRGGFYRDLRDHYLMSGLSEEEVRKLLGPPDASALWSNPNDVVFTDCINWELGHCEFMGGVSLQVCFDRENRISDVRHDSEFSIQ